MKNSEPREKTRYQTPCSRTINLRGGSDVLATSSPGNLEDYNYEDLF